MPNLTQGPLKEVISLGIVPIEHQSTPSIMGEAHSDEAGIVMYGFYNMDYRLPNNDRLRILANHNQHIAQLLLLTHDAKLITRLPGKRPASLVASTIAEVENYLRRTRRYDDKLTPHQHQKIKIANQCIHALTSHLSEERAIAPTDFEAQEQLRQAIITILDKARNDNALVANHPFVSEGALGLILYEAKQASQHYAFNIQHQVSLPDQLNFSDAPIHSHFIWDSETHIDHDEKMLNETIQVITEYYGLNPADELRSLGANRWIRASRYFKKLWRDGVDWINHLTQVQTPCAETHTKIEHNGLITTSSTPYYTLNGTPQKGYTTLQDLMTHVTQKIYAPLIAQNTSEAFQLLNRHANGHWVNLEQNSTLIYRLNDENHFLPYFKDPLDNAFYPLPNGNDLYTLCLLSKRHLFLPERASLHLHVFFVKIPALLKHTYIHIRDFIKNTLVLNFKHHIHHDHLVWPPLAHRLGQLGIQFSKQDIRAFNAQWITHSNKLPDQLNKPTFNQYFRRHLINSLKHTNLSNTEILHIITDNSTFNSIKEKSWIHYQQHQSHHTQIMQQRTTITKALKERGLLPNGQDLEQFIKNAIENSQWVVAKSDHPPHPIHYDNPIHRGINVLRHISRFFVDTGEKNPLLGTLAMVAYFYGGAAIISPQALTSLLTKLHLKGLISGIAPTQTIARLMSHGTSSEAMSAAVTYWQSTIGIGNIDQFFLEAIEVVKNNPAEVAIITALALSLGYGMCQAIPLLNQEMGQFPVANYAALGAKGGAAIYDTIMHPGDDWLLGTIKWGLKGLLTFSKIFIAPVFEGVHYGFKEGFMNGLSKSFFLLLQFCKEIFVACIDITLSLLTLPFLELPALFIHIPFRGLSHFITKSLTTLGHLSTIGTAMINFSTRSNGWGYFNGLRLSPMYGFNLFFNHYSENFLINCLINSLSYCYKIPLQLVKNGLLLPISDSLSFLGRVFLVSTNLTTRFLAMIIAYPLIAIGTYTDPGIGIILKTIAHSITKSVNWIDQCAGSFKQSRLSDIQILRATLFHWAFIAKPAPIKPVNLTNDYFFKNITRLEKIPHDSDHCLLKQFIDDKHSRSQTFFTPSANEAHAHQNKTLNH